MSNIVRRFTTQLFAAPTFRDVMSWTSRYRYGSNHYRHGIQDRRQSCKYRCDSIYTSRTETVYIKCRCVGGPKKVQVSTEPRIILRPITIPLLRSFCCAATQMTVSSASFPWRQSIISDHVVHPLTPSSGETSQGDKHRQPPAHILQVDITHTSPPFPSFSVLKPDAFPSTHNHPSHPSSSTPWPFPTPH